MALLCACGEMEAPLDIGAPDRDASSADVDALDLGDLSPADLGPAEIGAPDLGPQDLGDQDLGLLDLGNADMGAQDLGPMDMGPTCTATLTACGEACVDIYADPQHCGDCNVACTGAEACLWGVCAAPPAAITSTASAVLYDGPDECLVSPNGTSIDATNNIYVALLCGDSSTPEMKVARVATSTDAGVSYSAPLDLGARGVRSVALMGAGPGRAHAVISLVSGVLLYTRTTDAGQSWSRPRAVDGGPLEIFDPHLLNILAWRDRVYLGVPEPEFVGYRLWRNAAEGQGPFTLTQLNTPRSCQITPVLDPQTGTLFISSGTYEDREDFLFLSQSQDFGQSFSLTSTTGMSTAVDPDCVTYLWNGKELLSIDIFTGIERRSFIGGPSGLIQTPPGIIYDRSPRFDTDETGRLYILAIRDLFPFPPPAPDPTLSILVIEPGALAYSQEQTLATLVRPGLFEVPAIDVEISVFKNSKAIVALYTNGGVVFSQTKVFP